MVKRGALSGFTLIEMLIVITIASILLAIGIPSFRELVADQRVRSEASNFSSAFAFARAEAAKRGRRVVVRPVDGASWQSGWIVFANADGNPAFTQDPANDAERTLLQNAAIQGGVSVCAVALPIPAAIIFSPDGRISTIVNNAAQSTNADNDGLKLSIDTVNPPKIRVLYFGLSGRVNVVNANNTAEGPC